MMTQKQVGKTIFGGILVNQGKYFRDEGRGDDSFYCCSKKGYFNPVSTFFKCQLDTIIRINIGQG